MRPTDGATFSLAFAATGAGAAADAAGLAVAIPAVLGYNLLGRQLNQIEAELEGFAHDLRALLADPQD